MLLHLAAINEGMAAGFFSPADPVALAHLAGFPGASPSASSSQG
jgi:hypothetical protein